jgi:hypothetical protein
MSNCDMAKAAQSSNCSHCGCPFALRTSSQSQEIVGIIVSAVAVSVAGSLAMQESRGQADKERDFLGEGRVATHRRVSGKPMPEHV